MKLFIGASYLDTNQGTGMFRYLNNLFNGWSAQRDKNQYTVVTRFPADLPVKRDPRFTFTTLSPRLSGKIFVWQNYDLPLYFKKEKYDALFFPTYFTPYWGVKDPLVTVIYDVYYLAHPEWVPYTKYYLMKWGTMKAAKQSRIIICGSEYDKGQIIQYLRVKPDNVKVIYGAAENKFIKQTPHPNYRNKYGLNKYRVLSCVGLLFNRRHQDVVIKAFDEFADKEDDVALLLVGKNVTYPHIDFQELISKCKNSERIIHVEYMPEEDMVDMYNASDAIIYLSSHEGESFPLREALACGIPCMSTPILREVCGNAAVYVEDPTDVECVANGMMEVLCRKTELSSIAQSMKSTRTWLNIASETLLYISQASGKQ